MTKGQRFRWWIAGLLFFGTALSFFDRQVLSILAPILKKDLAVDEQTYAYVVTSFVAAYTVMYTLGGRFIDWLGTRKGMFKNTLADIEMILTTCAENNTRFEVECYDISHLYTLKHFLDRGVIKAPQVGQVLTSTDMASPARGGRHRYSRGRRRPVAPRRRGRPRRRSRHRRRGLGGASQPQGRVTCRTSERRRRAARLAARSAYPSTPRRCGSAPSRGRRSSRPEGTTAPWWWGAASRPPAYRLP